MEIETYEIEDATSEASTMANDAVALELIEKLGLTGQQKLMNKETVTRVPYRVMEEQEFQVYKALCPTVKSPANYDLDPIPVRILQVITYAQSLEFFTKLEIWCPNPAILGSGGPRGSDRRSPVTSSWHRSSMHKSGSLHRHRTHDGRPACLARLPNFPMNPMNHETIDELLAAYDAGQSVFTLSMGGLGPGYEQVIQLAAIEFARAGKSMPRTADDEADYKTFDAICNTALAKFDEDLGGMTGAQYGAARWLAWQWCFGGGPAALLKRSEEHNAKDRVIQISKFFPKVPAAS